MLFLLFFAAGTDSIMGREYKGNYEKPNCKMRSATTFERTMIPIRTLFSFLIKRDLNILYYGIK